MYMSIYICMYISNGLLPQNTGLRFRIQGLGFRLLVWRFGKERQVDISPNRHGEVRGV